MKLQTLLMVLLLAAALLASADVVEVKERLGFDEFVSESSQAVHFAPSKHCIAPNSENKCTDPKFSRPRCLSSNDNCRCCDNTVS